MRDVAAELVGVTQRYGQHVALRDVSLTLRRGEVVALLGPNGAGKTTAVKLLLGLLQPTAGTAKVFGASPKVAQTRMRMGAMLQVSKVPDTVKVREYIELFRCYYPKPMAYDEIVQRAGLKGIEDKLLGSLSGGQRQRVLFGLAMCGDPDLIFLDEPTLGMDIEARHAVWAEVRRMRDAGKTVLLTTHYLEEADSLADRIVVIRTGEIVAEGTPREIKGNVAGRKIKCVTRLSVAELKAWPAVTEATMHDAVTVVTTLAAEEVLRRMLAEDAGLSGLEVSSPALEDAFLALTAEKEVL